MLRELEQAKERARVVEISKEKVIVKLKQELDTVGWSASQAALDF